MTATHLGVGATAAVGGWTGLGGFLAYLAASGLRRRRAQTGTTVAGQDGAQTELDAVFTSGSV